jgi:integrase
MSTITTFSEIAPLYLAQRQVCDAYRDHVCKVAARAGAISTERLNRYLVKRIEERSGYTVKNERTILLSLWRWAYDAGHLDAGPRGVMRMKARKKPTKAWTVPQIQAVIKATHDHDGVTLRSGADKGEMLRCWLLLGYETGARFGDVFAFRREHLDDDAISWTQSKTGDPLTRSLTPACLTAIDEMLARSPDGTILGWSCRKRQAMRHMREHLDSVGVGGTSKFLRRSSATHCEMEKAGAGRLHLGHRSPALFEQAYCDWSQLRSRTPKPPALM